MTFVSYAQNFEDIMLWRALRHVPEGFYIDVGACGPDADSVTRAFYDRGWRGVNIEPGAMDFRRLRLGRPRDINLNVAVGEQAGRQKFFNVPGTGLSTLEASSVPAIRQAGFEPQADDIEVMTLAEICRLHAAPVIHFLKVDVEGGEGAVLAGADFKTFRPWIVLVEATAPMSAALTHASWEQILTDAGYRFVWFDGLNRFYLVAEQFEALQGHFQIPPNVFDDFVRAADSDVAQRIASAEARIMELVGRVVAAEARAASATAENLAILSRQHERIALGETPHQTMQAQQALVAARAKNVVIKAEADFALASYQGSVSAERLAWDTRSGQLDWLWMMRNAVLASSSWRVTAPLRFVSNLLRPRLPPPPYPELPVPAGPPGTPQHLPPAAQPIRIVHQFHSGSATGDAITNAMLLMRHVLRSLGYASEIFVEHRDQDFADEFRLMEELPDHDGYVLIFRHSMGFDRFDEIMALTAPKILLYHNITPPELLDSNPALQTYSRLGRAQLSRAGKQVCAALGDSEYNAIELRKLGFVNVQACALLFDAAALRRHAGSRATTGVFTIMFVGRIIESKGQMPLILAFARFRALFGAPCRLVLVGRCDAAGKDYLRPLDSVLPSGESLKADVVITGMISDEERDAYYAEADLYVSLSRHEGFGVPLAEAMAHGVPILAWPAGAVPYTMGPGAEFLSDTTPETVTAAMLHLAKHPEARAGIVERQIQNLKKFDLDAQIPILLNALARAGAAMPAPHGAGALLTENMRFEITGHFTSSYSLAIVNRNLALAIEDVRPRHVRVRPVAAEADGFEANIPMAQRARIVELQARAPHETGPLVVISQHYPVLVPQIRGDVLLALFFWEESLIPATTIDQLCANFDGILAPSQFVAKILLESGCEIPLFCLEQTPDLVKFHGLSHIPSSTGVFTFLHVSSGFPRKGVDTLLAAYAKTFRAHDNVRLIIKTFTNPHNDVAAQILALQNHDEGVAEICLINRDLDERAFLNLYATADAIVLPTRGEGFNLPAAEALAAGVKLIVTGQGGHLDFCNSGNARLVDYNFAPSRSHLATPHSVWVEPDLDDLAAAMREVWKQKDVVRSPAAKMGDPVSMVADLADFAAARLLNPPAPVSIAFVSSWDVRCGVAGYSQALVAAFPASDRISRFAILADDRTPAQSGAVKVLPVWQIGNPETLPALLMAIAVTDPDIVVIQHQPGLMPWTMLADLISAVRRQGRLATVTLHNTRHFLEINETERGDCLMDLAGATRIIVHTIADLNRLKALGLVDNVVMFPQGATMPVSQTPARVLTPRESPLIGSYGFLLPGKGLPQLVEAFGEIRKHWPAARLRLVNAHYGRPDSDAELALCKQAAEANGSAAAIEWHTDFIPHGDSVRLLAECDLLALPYQSSLEASSAALRTAFSAGVPVIVTPLALFDEAEDAVFRFSGKSSIDIAAGLAAALKDTVARTSKKAAAIDWIETRQWGEIAKRLQGMLIGLAVKARI